MDQNQNPSVAVPPSSHPSLFGFGVLLVKDGDRQWVQQKLRSPFEADPVLAEIALCFDRIPFESVAQLSPAVWSTAAVIVNLEITLRGRHLNLPNSHPSSGLLRLKSSSL